MSNHRRRIERLEWAAGPTETFPSLGDLPWAQIVARLPLRRMYPNNPEIWRRHGQS